MASQSNGKDRPMREYPDRPLIGVGGVVWHQGRVLLIKRGKPPGLGQWSLPGGAQKLGETVYQAAAREVREETGLTCHPQGIIDVVDSIQRDADGRIHYHYTLVDVLALADGDTICAASDAAECAWFCNDDLDGLGLWSETRRVIDLAKEMADALAQTTR